MSLLILTAVVAVNFVIVLSVTLSPTTFAWISPGSMGAVALVQAIIVFLVYDIQKHLGQY